MFPLREVLRMHGRPERLEELGDSLKNLLPDLSVFGKECEVFRANQSGWAGGEFLIEQSGYGQPCKWTANVIVIPSALLAVLIVIEKDSLETATTLLATSITSVTLKLGSISREEIHLVSDE